VLQHFRRSDYSNNPVEWSIAMTQFNKTLSAAFLAVSLVSVAGCASTPTQQGTGEYFDDSVVTAKIKAAILEDPVTKILDIKVTTFRGAVQLSGFVSSQAEADRAVELARGVAGVKSVKNEMQIK
jgi:osmotically-inducible protein OsmY